MTICWLASSQHPMASRVPRALMRIVKLIRIALIPAGLRPPSRMISAAWSKMTRSARVSSSGSTKLNWKLSFQRSWKTSRPTMGSPLMSTALGSFRASVSGTDTIR